MKDLISDTIEKIKERHVKPEPKWRYLMKKYGIWAAFALVVVFGAASFSAAYYLLSSLDWDLYRFAHSNPFSYSLSIFPYFWAILIGMFMLVAFFDVRRTETGYRFSWLKISLMTIGSIIVLGAAMSFAGLGERFNMLMADGMPYYGQHMMVTKETQWSNPGAGFLSGTIDSVSGNDVFLQDLSGKKWDIKLNAETLIRPAADVSKGQMIKIIGTETDSNAFKATEIRPWVGVGQGMMQGLQSGQSGSNAGGAMNRSGQGGMMRRN